MRKPDSRQQEMFSYKSIEERIPEDHPIRALRDLVDDALGRLSRDFDKMYAKGGRPSIPPERLLRALLVQVFFSVRSERQLMEQLDYNLMFRWFVGLGMDDPVWDHSTFSKNRERLLKGDVADKFFKKVLEMAQDHELMSQEHFTVDGTLIEAWASHKSFKPKDTDDDDSSGGKNPDVDFKGQRRKNDTHQSTTDKDCRLFRKSRRTGAQLCYMGHVLMDNRHGLVVDALITRAEGKGEHKGAISMIEEMKGTHRITLGCDKGYDDGTFISRLREMKVTPHIAQNNSATHTSYIDDRTTRHEGYSVSQRKRKLVEQIFGWGKTIGNLRKTKYRGLGKVNWMTKLTMSAYNLIRIRNLAFAAS